MAKEPKGGVSLRREDRTAAILGIGPGRTTLKKVRYENFEYIKKGQRRGTIAPVALVQWERDGEIHKTPYSIGNGWRIENKGLAIKSRSNQAGIPEGCNFAHLIDSLEDAKGYPMPGDFLQSIDQLDGIDVELITKPIERDFGDKKDTKGNDTGGVRRSTLLVVGEVYDAPWAEDESDKKKHKAKAKARDEDEDEDEEDEDGETDEDEDDDDKPVKKGNKGKRGADADDDDEDDEKPAKKKRAASKDDDDDEDAEEEEKPKAKGGKARSSDEEDIDEAAVEALTDLLEEEESMKVGEIEAVLLKRLKKAKLPNYDEIAARAIEDDFLDQEKGWVRKGSRVTLDK